MEASDAHVVCFQEALTYYHLRLLAERMPSFQEVLFKRTLAGPAGGVVTFSRLAADSVWYRGFPLSAPNGVPVRTAITSLLKGVLVARLRAGHTLSTCIPWPTQTAIGRPATGTRGSSDAN